MHLPNRFNIRVYGLLYHSQNEILLSKENINGFEFTKFPGGGLEFGEGTHACLQREFMEECGIKVQIEKHIYTTDFYQPSAFNKEDQLISIYYKVSCHPNAPINLDWQVVAESPHPNHQISFFWMPLNALSPDMLTFPIDKHVAALILKQD